MFIAPVSDSFLLNVVVGLVKLIDPVKNLLKNVSAVSYKRKEHRILFDEEILGSYNFVFKRI